MFKKAIFGLTLVASCMLSGQAWALPKSMMMTTEFSSNEGGQSIKATAKIWYSAMKFRTEVTNNFKMPANVSSPVKISNQATIIMDMNKKVGYLIDGTSKTAMKIDIAQLNNLNGGNAANPQNFTNPDFLSNPAKLKAELKKQGAKEVGKAKMFNRPVTVWQMTNKARIPAANGAAAKTENITIKLWLADDISVPLKAEITSARGVLATMITKDLKVDIPVSNSLFDVPKGYKVTNMEQMFNMPK